MTEKGLDVFDFQVLRPWQSVGRAFVPTADTVLQAFSRQFACWPLLFSQFDRLHLRRRLRLVRLLVRDF